MFQFKYTVVKIIEHFFIQMKMLGERQKEERKNFRKQMEDDLGAQREQMDNMMEANMQQAQEERERFMQENQQL